MKYARLLFLLPALGALGCPGDWDEPLGPARGGRIDSSLLGEWRCTSSDDKAPGRLTIAAFDANQYVMTIRPSDEKEKTAFYRAYTTTVSGYDVMNVKELGADPGDGAWTYARFLHPQADRLQIELLLTEPLDGTPNDLESRRAAIGDLFPEAALWAGLLRCQSGTDAEKDEPAADLDRASTKHTSR